MRNSDQFGIENFLRARLLVEAVNLRVRVVQPRPSAPVNPPPPPGIGGEPDWADIQLGGKTQRARFSARDALRPGDRITGPAVTEEATATTLAPPGWRAACLPYGSPAAGARAMTDPVRLAIPACGLRAIADEMGINLVRTAFSTVVRGARDCLTAQLDAQGRVNQPFALRAVPMPTMAGCGGRPWFLPLVGGWYRLLDWWYRRRD